MVQPRIATVEVVGSIIPVVPGVRSLARSWLSGNDGAGWQGSSARSPLGCRAGRAQPEPAFHRRGAADAIDEIIAFLSNVRSDIAILTLRIGGHHGPGLPLRREGDLRRAVAVSAVFPHSAGW